MATRIRKTKIFTDSGNDTIHPQTEVAAVIDFPAALDAYTEQFITPKIITAHNNLNNRDAADSHPISAVTNLQPELSKKIEDVISEIQSAFPSSSSSPVIADLITIAHNGKRYLSSSVAGNLYEIDGDNLINVFTGMRVMGSLLIKGFTHFFGINQGLWRLNNDGTFTQISSLQLRRGNVMSNGTVYFSTNAGTYYYDNTTDTLLPTNLTTGFSLLYMTIPGKADYLFHNDASVWTITANPAVLTKVSTLSGNPTGWLVGKDGNVYLGRGDRLVRFNTTTGAGTDIISNLGGNVGQPDIFVYNSAPNMALGNDGYIYVATNAGAFKLDTVNYTSTIVPMAGGNNSNPLLSAYKSKNDGNIYFGGNNGTGIWKINPDTGIGEKLALPGAATTAHIWEIENTLYFGTQNAGDNVYAISFIRFNGFLRKQGEWILPSIDSIQELRNELDSIKQSISNLQMSDIAGLIQAFANMQQDYTNKINNLIKVAEGMTEQQVIDFSELNPDSLVIGIDMQ